MDHSLSRLRGPGAANADTSDGPRSTSQDSQIVAATYEAVRRVAGSAGTLTTTSTHAAATVIAEGLLLSDGVVVDPDDGWQIRELEHLENDGLSLWLELKMSGDAFPHYSHKVFYVPSRDVAARGVLALWRRIWEAVARYLNAGGAAEDLSDVLNAWRPQIPQIKFPGYFLRNTEAKLLLEMPRHTFGLETDPSQLLVWIEGAWLEVTDVDTENYRREEEEEYDREDV